MAAFENCENQDMISGPRPGYRNTRGGGAHDNQNGLEWFWNVMTILVWLGIIGMIVAFVTIYLDPGSSLNVLRPFQPTLVAVIDLPTETPVIYTDTPELASVLDEIPTPQPPTLTATQEPTSTETPTPGPSPTATVDTIYPFILRNEPAAISGVAIPDHETCKLWVAGQTYDLQGAPMVGVTVMLGGYLNGKSLSQLSLTGTSLQFGQAGYEFVVADQPIESQGSVWVQIFDQSFIPLSGRIYVDTYEDCQQNLILINFKQVR